VVPVGDKVSELVVVEEVPAAALEPEHCGK